MIKILKIKELRKNLEDDIIAQSARDKSTLFGFDTKRIVMGGTSVTTEQSGLTGYCFYTVSCLATRDQADCK